jgi:nitrogen regulatory protein P-II 1
MKRIEAIVRPSKIAYVCAVLDRIDHPGLTLMDVEGHGRQKGIEQEVQGKTYKVGLMNKVRIEMVVKDDDVDRITTAICEAAVTGKVGDGKIFVYPVEDAIRIRTGERGLAAIA